MAEEITTSQETPAMVSEELVQKTRRFRFTKKQIREAIYECDGVVFQVAKMLNCTTQTIYQYMKRFPDLKDDLIEAERAMVCVAENCVTQAIRNGSSQDARWYLSHVHRTKYGDRVEVSGNVTNIPSTSLEDISGRPLTEAERADLLSLYLQSKAPNEKEPKDT